MSSEQLAYVADADLVAAVGSRDDDAVAELMRRHRGPVVAFARRLVGDHARAEEVTQDVFLKLWERWDRYDSSNGTVRTFLLAMTHGRALDVVRSDTARVRREMRDGEQPQPVVADAHSQLVARSTATVLRRALQALPEAERRAVELAYLGSHSYRTVATLLGEPEGTVKSRIRTGLARLRVALSDQDL